MTEEPQALIQVRGQPKRDMDTLLNKKQKEYNTYKHNHEIVKKNYIIHNDYK